MLLVPLEKTKTIWVCSLNLKANLTESFVHQHHKTSDIPVTKFLQTSDTEKHPPSKLSLRVPA